MRGPCQKKELIFLYLVGSEILVLSEIGNKLITSGLFFTLSLLDLLEFGMEFEEEIFH